MSIFSHVLPRGLAFLSAVFVSLLASAPNTPAQSSSLAPAQEHVNVVARLPLGSMHVNQMFMQQWDGKFYLYLHRPTKEAFALVDVSKAYKPILLSRDALDESPRTQVQPPTADSVLAVGFTQEGAAPHVTSVPVEFPTQTVQLVDMSDPKSPRTVKMFKDVTSIYRDDARKLLYLVNAEGLWIVSHHITRPLPLCTSGDALNPLPNCQ